MKQQKQTEKGHRWHPPPPRLQGPDATALSFTVALQRPTSDVMDNTSMVYTVYDAWAYFIHLRINHPPAPGQIVFSNLHLD